MIHTEHLLSFWKPGILACLEQRVPKWPGPKKTLGSGSSVSCPGGQDVPCASTVHCGYPVSLLEWTSSGFLWAWPRVPFPLLVCFCYNKSLLWVWLCFKSYESWLVLGVLNTGDIKDIKLCVWPDHRQKKVGRKLTGKLTYLRETMFPFFLLGMYICPFSWERLGI